MCIHKHRYAYAMSLTMQLKVVLYDNFSFDSLYFPFCVYTLNSFRNAPVIVTVLVCLPVHM
jgi:hypothetical protein